MDGHPRQNPAYRPATEKALETGLFLWTRFAGDSSGSPPGRADCGLRGTARRGRPAWPQGPCRQRAAPRSKANRRGSRVRGRVAAGLEPAGESPDQRKRNHEKRDGTETADDPSRELSRFRGIEEVVLVVAAHPGLRTWNPNPQTPPTSLDPRPAVASTHQPRKTYGGDEPCRSSIAARSFDPIVDLLSTSGRNCHCAMPWQSMSVVATIVAVLVEPVRSATSPK